MAQLTADCPRCGVKHTTFDLQGQSVRTSVPSSLKAVWEVFARCRACDYPTIFRVRANGQGQAAAPEQLPAVNWSFDVVGYVSLKDLSSAKPPEHVPSLVQAAFIEGATCMAVECFNAAGTMFRLCIDLATQGLLPTPAVGGSPAAGEPNSKQRRDLGLRLPWLFEAGLLPAGLHDLSTCVKEDGNDGAHKGTLQRADVEDIQDFAMALLERLFTEPKRLEEAAARRSARRNL